MKAVSFEQVARIQQRHERDHKHRMRYRRPVTRPEADRATLLQFLLQQQNQEVGLRALLVSLEGEVKQLREHGGLDRLLLEQEVVLRQQAEAALAAAYARAKAPAPPAAAEAQGLGAGRLAVIKCDMVELGAHLGAEGQFTPEMSKVAFHALGELLACIDQLEIQAKGRQKELDDYTAAFRKRRKEWRAEQMAAGDREVALAARLATLEAAGAAGAGEADEWRNAYKVLLAQVEPLEATCRERATSVASLREQLQEAADEYKALDEEAHGLQVQLRRDTTWMAVVEHVPSTTTPYVVAAPAPHGQGLITLRRTFLYMGDGIWGVHGKMESTRSDITHFRELPTPPSAPAPKQQPEAEGGQASKPCTCSFLAQTVGDGCHKCNPECHELD